MHAHGRRRRAFWHRRRAGTEVQYKTTDYWPPEHEHAVLWNDPALAIDRRLGGAPILSGKDSQGKLLADAEAFA